MITENIMQTNKLISKLTLNLLAVVLCAISAPTKIYCQAADQKEFKVWAIPNINEGAEFYFSPDGKRLIGNAKMNDDPVHQVYTFNVDGTDILRINNLGEDACSFYFPDGKRLLFTSTRDNLDMPKGNYSDPKDYPQGAEIYSCNLDGSDVKRLTNNRYYDAEISISPDGKWLLFTRQIDGKLDLWKMRPDGKTLTFDSNRDAKNGDRKLRPYLMDISSLNLGEKK